MKPKTKEILDRLNRELDEKGYPKIKPAEPKQHLSSQNKALAYLKGLRDDIRQSVTGTIEIEGTDIEQINNCISLIKTQNPSKEG
jgi:hypothetical protein